MRKLHTQALYTHTVHGGAKFANNVSIQCFRNKKSPALGRAHVYFLCTIGGIRGGGGGGGGRTSPRTFLVGGGGGGGGFWAITTPKDWEV
ncbi:hypothetical protein D3C84_868020 [compost metagenome]